MARVYLRARRGKPPSYWLDYRDERGARVREPARGHDGRPLTNKAAAERALRDAMVNAQTRRRDPWALRGDGSTLLKDWLDTHERDHVAQLRGANVVTLRLRYWREHFGERARLLDVTKPEIERYVAARLKERKPATITRELAALSRAMTKAVEAGLIPVNPCVGVRKPANVGARIRWLSEKEADKLLEAARASRSRHLTLMMLFALDAGGRFGEIAALTRGDLDMENGTILFRVTKSGKARHVPMTPRLRAALTRLPRNRDARIFNVASVKKGFERARIRAGLGKDVVFHSLRHTFATWLMQRGAAINVVSRLMGHASIAMTMKYAHSGDVHARETIDLLTPKAAPSRHKGEKPTAGDDDASD